MGKITTQCLKCNTPYTLNSDLIGKKAKCAKCSNIFVIQSIAQEENRESQRLQQTGITTTVPPKEDRISDTKNEEQLIEALSKKFNMAQIKWDDYSFDDSLLELIPEHLARKHNIFPYAIEHGMEPKITLAVADPSNTSAIAESMFITKGCHVEVAIASIHSIKDAIQRYYQREEPDSNTWESNQRDFSSQQQLLKMSEPFDESSYRPQTVSELIQQKREIIRHFKRIVKEYTQTKNNAEAAFNAKKKNAKDELETKRKAEQEHFWKFSGELNQKIDKISSNAKQAKNLLEWHWWEAISDVQTLPSKLENSSNPRANFENCVTESNHLLENIRILKKEPIPVNWEYVPRYTTWYGIVVIFLVSWIILMMTNLMFIGINKGWLFAAVVSVVIAFSITQFWKNERRNLYIKLLQLHANAKQLHETCIQPFDDEYKTKINEVEKEYEAKLREAKIEYQNTMRTIEQNFERNMKTVYHSVINFTNQIAELSPEWSDERWKVFKPATDIPLATRTGRLTKHLIGYDVSIPALFPFPGTHPMLFKGDSTANSIVVPAIQSLLLRLLATIPPGKLYFTFIDPVALGQNVASFMHLADFDDDLGFSLVNSRSWSEKQHIEQRLVELTEHMENVIQKYLRNTYATIEEYNEQAGEVAEPYRFLVIMNFPVNFSEEAARRLVSIVQNGPRCGVYTLIFYDTEQPLPYGFNANDLEQFMIIFSGWDGISFNIEDDDFGDCFLELENPPIDEIFNTIIEKVGQEAIETSKVEVPFEKILEKADLNSENLWKGSTAGGIHIPLGPIGANKVQYLEFGKGTAQHALVAGKTGSGKSTLLHVLIGTLALRYSPNEMELYLIDFKKGVEFKTYATYQLPHARVIAIESEREFGLSVLEGLDVELKRRGDMFRDVGVDGLKEYRQATKKKMPRILLLVDEFQEFFTYDDAIASKASQILDRLVRQGRAFGIHVLLGSQTLSGAYTLARSTVDQMANRIALQCSEADSRLILSDDNPAARLLSRPGEAIYNSANGLIEGNSPFQIAWLSDDKQKKYLKQIAALGKKTGHYPPRNQIVFEGNAPVDVGKNLPLKTFLLKTQRTAFVRRAEAWLGEPIAIKDATTAHFRRQSGSNLLIVGQNDEAAMGMLMIALLSLSVQYQSESAQFYLVDFGNVDAPHVQVLSFLTRILLHHAKHGRRRHLPDIINTVAQEVEYRLEREEESLEKKPSIYLVIYGLQRARDLEQDDIIGVDYSAPPAFGASNEPAPPPPSNPGKQFPKILREGPDLGIHTIVWCDTAKNLQRRLDRQALREFEMRVVFQMSNDDSLNLIDSSAASKLGQHRALFYSEEEGRLEKFRPFALPGERWLKKIGEKLQKTA